jgi:hypothetical protein
MVTTTLFVVMITSVGGGVLMPMLIPRLGLVKEAPEVAEAAEADKEPLDGASSGRGAAGGGGSGSDGGAPHATGPGSAEEAYRLLPGPRRSTSSWDNFLDGNSSGVGDGFGGGGSSSGSRGGGPTPRRKNNYSAVASASPPTLPGNGLFLSGRDVDGDGGGSASEYDSERNLLDSPH